MHGKTAGTRKNDGKQIGNCAVKISALQSCITLHRTLEGDKFDLDPLLCEISALCCNDEGNGVRIRHQTNGQL